MISVCVCEIKVAFATFHKIITVTERNVICSAVFEIK